MFKSLALGVLVFVLTQGTASAGQVTIAFTGGPGITAYYGGRDGAGGTAVSAGVGDSRITVTDPTGLEGMPASFYTFCVDLQRRAGTSGTATLESMSGWELLAGATDHQKLGASFLANQYFSKYPNGEASSTVAAYYQIAIWELLHERQFAPDFSAWVVAGGSTWFSSVAGTKGAQNLIRGIDTTSLLYRYSGHLVIDDHGVYGQNFIAPVPAPGPVSTPVPDGGTTLMLLGGALIGLDVLRRRLRP